MLEPPGLQGIEPGDPVVAVAILHLEVGALDRAVVEQLAQLMRHRAASS